MLEPRRTAYASLPGPDAQGLFSFNPIYECIFLHHHVLSSDLVKTHLVWNSNHNSRIILKYKKKAMGNLTVGMAPLGSRQATPEVTEKDKQYPSAQTSKIHDYPDVLAEPHNASRHSERGYWVGTDTAKLHKSFTDSAFAMQLPKFLKQENCTSVIDIGAGNGLYSQAIADGGIFVNCYDGNPDTQKVSNGRCAVLDFSQAINLPCKYDWVLSLKVGKHIPKEYEYNFIQNLHRMNRHGIIINWGGTSNATPHTPANVKYFNHQSDSYIIEKFTKLGYVHDVKAEQVIRNFATEATLRSRLLVFRKKDSTSLVI